MPAQHYLACDLGAESGRLMLATHDAGRLQLREVHRFPNGPVSAGESLHWDMQRLMDGLMEGLRIVGQSGETITAISADSWGLDYVLVDREGAVMKPAFHYRDPRTTRGVAAVESRVPREKVFDETGIQFLAMNSIFQLAVEPPERLAVADKVLLVGDAFNFFLSGVARAEVSLASTSQLYNPRTRRWSTHLLTALELPERLFPEIVPSGTVLGPMRESVVAETGVNGQVIASCSHDTGAAVAAVPAGEGHWAYISSGTWSLMGVEVEEPVVTDACRELNFTNEIGYGGTVRLLKNISGLWPVQECRREWNRAGRDWDYGTLTQMAAEAPPFVSLIDPTDPCFTAPGDMPKRICAYCREHNEPEPADEGAMVRCLLESLALLYRHTAGELGQLTGHGLNRLHIVGGGSQNVLLNQFAANALQIPVVAGPVEATSLGNVLVQLMALGELSSLGQARDLVRTSFPVQTYEPCDAAAWDRAAPRFDALHAATEGRS